MTLPNYVNSHNLSYNNVERNLLRKIALIESLIFATFFIINANSVYADDLADSFDLMDSELSLMLSSNQFESYQSYANIIQTGLFNQAIVNQTAQDSYSYIEQYGKDNYAEITQYGYGNNADIKQFGDGNKASVVQDGIGNIAGVVQFGQQQFSVLQIGNHESISIIQY